MKSPRKKVDSDHSFLQIDGDLSSPATPMPLGHRWGEGVVASLATPATNLHQERDDEFRKTLDTREPVDVLAREFPHVQAALDCVNSEWSCASSAPEFTVFINRSRIPDFVKRDIDKMCHERWPNADYKIVELNLEELQSYPLLFVADAEVAFCRDGFVFSDQFNGVGSGQADFISTFVARSQAAANHFLTYVVCYYDLYDPTKNHHEKHKLPRNVERAEMLREIGHALSGAGSVAGNKNEFHVRPRKGGIFLPLWKDTPTSLALASYCDDFAKSLNKGREDRFGLTRRDPVSIARQVRFEYDHCSELFGNATPVGVLLWQIQVLCMLRLNAWEVKVQGDLILEQKHEKVRHALRYVAAAGVRIRKMRELRGQIKSLFGHEVLEACERALWNEYQQTSIFLAKNALNPQDVYLDAFESLLRKRKKGARNQIIAFEEPLSQEDHVVCALHGGISGLYRLGTPLTDEQLRAACVEDWAHLYAIAAWLGRLKRTSAEWLDMTISSHIIAIDWTGSWGNEFFEQRVGDNAWGFLLQLANEVEKTSNKIGVRYNWSSDQCLRGVQLEGTELHITGPLLDFPTAKVEWWNERGQSLWRPESHTFWA